MMMTNGFGAINSGGATNPTPTSADELENSNSNDDFVSRGNAETYSFEATAPAKVPYTLLLRADPKPCEVTVTVTGR